MIDLVERSTIHGINHIFNASNKVFKVIWIFLFLFGIGGICVNVVIILMKYVSNPVFISITIEHEKFIWPDFTFCTPVAPFRFIPDNKSFFLWNKAILQSRELIKMIENKTDYYKVAYGSSINKEGYEFEERALALSSVNLRQIRAHVYSDHLMYIIYMKPRSDVYLFRDMYGNFDVFKDMESITFTQTVNIGNNYPCHTLRLRKWKDYNKISIKSLQIGIRFNIESYKVFNSSKGEKSVYLYITRNNEVPVEDPITLSPGYRNTLIIMQSKHLYSGIKQVCRNKIFKVELYDAMLESTDYFEGNYDMCKEIQFQSININICKCYSPFFPVHKIKNVLPILCLNASHFTKDQVVENVRCMLDVYKTQKEIQNRFDSRCIEFKPSKCNTINYKVVQQKEMIMDLWSTTNNDRRSAQFKSNHKTFFGEADKHTDVLQGIKEDFIHLAMNRESEFGNLYSEEKVYPFSELLSDVGGLMGLWLGMSVIGLFEILEFFYFSVATLCLKNRKKGDFQEVALNQIEHDI